MKSNFTKLLYKYPNFTDEGQRTKTGLPLDKLLLPNVQMEDIEASQLDEIISILGLDSLYERIFKNRSIDNRTKANKHLRRNYERLHKYAIEGKATQFDKLSGIMLSTSKALRVISLTRVEPR